MAKTKLTDKLCDEICNDIKAGVPIKHASVAHGITDATFYNWYNKGKVAKSGKFKIFHDKVEEAKSIAITLRARRIYKAGEMSWQADAWWLERVDPDNFGRKDKVHVDAKTKIESRSFDNLIRAFEESKKEWKQRQEEKTNSS